MIVILLFPRGMGFLSNWKEMLVLQNRFPLTLQGQGLGVWLWGEDRKRSLLLLSSLEGIWIDFFPDFIEIELTHNIVLKCTTLWFNICIYCTMIITGFVNIHYLNYNFFLGMRTFNVYSITDFQIYSIVWTAVTMLYITSPQLVCLIAGSL